MKKDFLENFLGVGSVVEDPPGERNEVWRNEGRFQFTAVEAGDLSTCPAGQGAIDTDFDGDGDIDVITANRTGDTNFLRNDGAGRFSLVAPSSIGVRHRAHDGATTADVDNDGDVGWLLVGRGRNGWEFDADGQGDIDDVSVGLGTNAAAFAAGFGDTRRNCG